MGLHLLHAVDPGAHGCATVRLQRTGYFGMKAGGKVVTLLCLVIAVVTLHVALDGLRMERFERLRGVSKAEDAVKTGFPEVQSDQEVDGNQEKKSCDLCGQRWLFVLATGRSGSTTVLNMLNALPGVYMAGENMNVVGKLRQLAFFPG